MPTSRREFRTQNRSCQQRADVGIRPYECGMPLGFQAGGQVVYGGADEADEAEAQGGRDGQQGHEHHAERHGELRKAPLHRLRLPLHR